MPIWTAERTVDRETATSLLDSQFPRLRPIEAVQLGFGWDNTAFLVNDELIFRFPRRASSVALLEKEMAVLPQLAPLLPLAIPHPVFFGVPTRQFPWPFAGYRFIQGETACVANLNDHDREGMAPMLGEFLKSLHGLAADDYKLSGDSQGLLDVCRRIPKIEENIDVVTRNNLVDHTLPFDEVLASAYGVEPESPGVVVHSDLYARHFVLDAKHILRGIIDWGDLHRNDPAIDLALVFNYLPPGRARSKFWEVYGETDDCRICLARLSALDHILTVLRYGDEIGDDDLIREGKTGVRYVFADLE